MAIILPRITRNVIEVISRGLRKMLAGMVLFSAAVGLVAIVASLFLSLPLWMTLAAYPVVCSVTLMLSGVLLSLRSRENAQNRQLVHTQA